MNAPLVNLEALLIELADRVAARVLAQMPPPPPAVEPSSEWLTTKAAAAYLGLKPNTLEIYRTAGGGPKYVKPTRNTVRYRHSDLVSWMEREQRSNTGANARRRKS